MFSCAEKAVIAVIERRAFFRDCIARSIAAASGLTVVGFPEIKDWLQYCELAETSIVMLCVGDAIQAKSDISFIFSSPFSPAVILLSDDDDSRYVVDSLEQGARGFFPTHISLGLAVEAIRLVGAGGTFVPADSLIAAQRRMESSASDRRYSSANLFTDRQIDVIESLRRGKTNKLIAHELAMSESTVKVHVHNVMKKLGVSNRTQVAFMANEMLSKERRLLKRAQDCQPDESAKGARVAEMTPARQRLHSTGII